ncbi:MAG: tyrosine-type recombinase/integrase [Bacteroidia bacterium]
MRYSINLDCKTHHVGKDGKFPILLRISLNGDHDYINTGKKIKESHYDKTDKSVRRGIKGFSQLDSFIDRQKLRIETIINDFDKKGEQVSISKIKEIYAQETGKVKSKCFYEFVNETIKNERMLGEISSDTLDNYDAQIGKLKKYRTKLSIHDIDVKFLEEYKSYLLKTLGQSKNTAYHAMCFLRKYTKMLFNDGKISPYPFAKFIVGKPFESEIDFLEPEELTALHDLYDSKELVDLVKVASNKHAKDFNVGSKYQEVLRYFLVACYTGLRHSDIKTLRREHIKGKFIVKTLKKGRKGRQKLVRIPIRKRLYSLLEMTTPKELLFQSAVMETSQTNKYLIKIMAIANIDKKINFHVSRHSFAVISLMLGIKIEVVSDILGHSELTTTQRYARVVDRLREQEMNKWDKLVSDELNSENCLEIICPSCENQVAKFEKGIFKLTKIPCVCQLCATHFSFSMADISFSSKELVPSP